MESAEISQLYQDGACYDRMYHGGHDLAFWIDRAKGCGGPVLELAVGTGRIAIPLAAGGCDVTGIDSSEAMLTRGREKASAAGVEVDWGSADMRDFDLGRTFPLIILANNTLCHLLTRLDFERCMTCVRRQLATGGRFIIDVFVPSLRILLHDPEQRHPFASYEDSDTGRTVTVTAGNRYESHTQINRITMFRTVSGASEEETGTLDMRMYFPQELDALLEYNGLRIEHKFGNFDRDPFDANSPKQVIVCAP